MADAARALLASLDGPAAARARAPFETDDRQDWTYLPGQRPGLALADMSAPQRRRALALLDSGLSAAGARTAREIMALESVLRDLERGRGKPDADLRDPHAYWFRMLGVPDERVWAWSVGGHHLAVHLTVVDGHCAGTPAFFGANPAVVPAGPRAGFQPLEREETLARDLLRALGPAQRADAVLAGTPPADIRTRHDPVADPSLLPRGLPHRRMEPAQQRLLEQLVRRYLGRVTDEVAAEAWGALCAAGTGALEFSWQGSTEPGAGHYYAVKGPTLLIEYDNTQDGANHAHSVWRDLRRDWGTDLLAEHHARFHKAPPRPLARPSRATNRAQPGDAAGESPRR